jgi:hypothetical protein
MNTKDELIAGVGMPESARALGMAPRLALRRYRGQDLRRIIGIKMMPFDSTGRHLLPGLGLSGRRVFVGPG